MVLICILIFVQESNQKTRGAWFVRELQPCEPTQQFLWIDQSQPGTLFLHCSCTCFLSHSLGQNLYALYIQPMEISHSHKSVKIVVVEIDTILQRSITCSTSTCETIWEIDSALTPAFIGNQDVQDDGGWWCGRMERIEGAPHLHKLTCKLQVLKVKEVCGSDLAV